MSPEHHDLLHNLAHQSHQLLLDASPGQADASAVVLLDGATTDVINALLGREHRRADGIFFSGPEWACRLREALPHGPFSRFVDPSCGIGDLLIEMAWHLPLGKTLTDTLANWSRQFHGIDLHGPLAQLAWYRLQALAMRRHGYPNSKGLGPQFPRAQFAIGDALQLPWGLRAGDCVLMNPPFQAVMSPAWSRCCGGRVSAAALFLERALTDAPDGTTIVALVPEAIRSGSRFAKLRDFLHSRGVVHQFVACGRFSTEADIDVAIVSVTIGSHIVTKSAKGSEKHETLTLSDLAQVRVGTIVPHRDRKTRSSRPFLDVDGAPVWQHTQVTRRARFVGAVFSPPFVVVRRTSSPSDRERAKGTLVRGKEPVMVENHLLVLLPHKRTLAACQELMDTLADPRTTQWLNQMLRCRHLTVRVMRQLPIWTEA